MSTTREILESCYDGIKILTEEYFDSAIVGVTHDDRVIYDFKLLVNALVTNENMKQEEAIEYIEYNIIRSLPYIAEQAPVILYPIKEDV